MMEAQAKDLKAIEDYIYSSMNHTEEWREAEQAYQNILNSRSAKSDAVLDELERWLPKFNDGEHYTGLVAVDAIMKKIAELRQQKER